MFSYTRILLPATLASLALARTDLAGCTSTGVSSPAGASLLWYVPGTGEICAFLDCGGGAGAPVTTVPGCADYSGTATYSPSYLPGYAHETGSSATDSMGTVFQPTQWTSVSSFGAAETGSGYPTTWSSRSSAWSASVIIDSTVKSSITSAPSVGMASSAPPQSTTSAVGNGSVSTSTPKTTSGLSGAAPTAQAWMGGAGLLMGLGAVVAAL